MRNLFLISFLSIININSGFAYDRFVEYDPFNYGAKGDGITLDTEAIQAAIDSCHNAGGGKVLLQNGHFISGTIYMKDHVALYIEEGAVLKASNDLNHFPSISSAYSSYQKTMETNKMLIYAEGAKHISITGRGTIDGNGDHWVDGPYESPSFSVRPRIIHFRNCHNILIRDITLYNSASWVQSYQSCSNMVIDGITVDSRENKDIEKPRYADVPGRNTDGLDLVDCEKVRISNCFINSGDDAICLKSFSPDEVCRDITITNCIVSSNASGIKIGTETAGTFEDITIQNCVVFDTRAEAIAILSADGARIERINVSNISLRNIKGAAIAIRLGNRNRLYRENIKPNERPIISDIIIENIQGTGISADFGCSISGIRNFPVNNILLKNINLRFDGGGTANDSYKEIPENETGYPSGRMFGRLPAYGFFIRHAKNVTLNNIFLRFEKEEHRPSVLCDEVDQLEIKGLRASGTMHSPELVRLVDTKRVIISESKPATPIPVFLSVYGNSDEIILLNNFLKNAKQNVFFDKEVIKSSVIESGTF